MASLPAAEPTAAKDSKVTLWISDDEGDDTDDELDLFKLLGVDSDTESTSTEDTPLPPWKRSDSHINIKKLFPRLIDEERWVTELREEGEEEPGIVDDGYDGPLNWTQNFKSFTGAPLPFTSTPGPTITSNDPYTIFTHIWDKEIMSLIVRETNRYARELSKLQLEATIPDKHMEVKWEDCTIDELYVYFSLHILMSLQKVRLEQILFGGNKLSLPFFPEIMSLQRFQSVSRCLHFVDNSKLTETDKAVGKIKPILDHCNTKFTSLYKPRQFLDIDDSLLLTKDGSAQGIRLQANTMCIRTYELSEVFTGYLLKVVQYPGKDSGFDSKRKADIVMNLVEEYSGKGHRVVTDRYFSSVYLARLLRSKGFDAICEVRKARKDLPNIIRDLKEDEGSPNLYEYKGNKTRMVSCHCGDLSVVAWSEFDITAISTYHTQALRPNKRGIRRPVLTLDYYKVKEKISQRDEDMSDYLMLEKPTERWYVKLFKQILNISIRNSYVIYKYNMPANQCLSPADFRYKLANQLLDQYGVREVVEKARMMGNKQDNDSDDDSSSWTDIDSDEESNECSIM